MTVKTAKIHIGTDFVLLLCVLYLLDRDRILFLALMAAALHEIGHLTAIFLAGGRVQEIRLSAFGACIRLADAPMLSYSREILIAAAGPVLGLLAAFFSAAQGWLAFSGLNFALSVCNLLPVAPLDGGRIVQAALASRLSPESAERLMQASSGAVSVGLLGVCGYLTWNGACTVPMLLFSGFLSINFLRRKTASC